MVFANRIGLWVMLKKPTLTHELPKALGDLLYEI